MEGFLAQAQVVLGWIMVIGLLIGSHWLVGHIGHVLGWERGVKDVREWTRNTYPEGERVLPYPTRIFGEPLPTAWAWVRRHGFWT